MARFDWFRRLFPVPIESNCVRCGAPLRCNDWVMCEWCWEQTKEDPKMRDRIEAWMALDRARHGR
jgi:hypothetical protein